ncbi:hypothetical protein PybrP1_010565 [[Pythium] brassicae (nom. inval.)]|nr:hypothetical protein PybrP1_010565 [[Pythium] brassicae (nom. inval.)]
MGDGDSTSPYCSSTIAAIEHALARRFARTSRTRTRSTCLAVLRGRPERGAESALPDAQIRPLLSSHVIGFSKIFVTSMALFQVVLALLLLVDKATASARSQLASDGKVLPQLSSPVLEILHPPHSNLLLSTTDLHIEIAVRDETGAAEARDARLCISMDAIFIPTDVELTDGSSQLKETCFDHAASHTAFHVEGLVPGLAYAITAGLIRAARVVGISKRTFEVASVVLAEHGQRLSIAAALETGVQLHNAGDRQNAARVYRVVLDVTPDHPHALHLLGLVYYQDGWPHEGLELIDRAIARNASEPTFHNSRGLCLRFLGFEQESVQAFRHALEMNPLLHQAALNLGDALQALGKWEDAMHEYRRVAASAHQQHLTRIPTQPSDRPSEVQQEADVQTFVRDAWSRVCGLVRATDGLLDADQCLVDAIRRWPNEPRLRNDRGHVLVAQGQYEAALKEFEHSASLGSPVGMIYVANVFEFLGDAAESLEQYQLALRSLAPEFKYLETRIRLMMATVLPWVLPETQQLVDYYRLRFENDLDAIRNDMETLQRADLDPSLIAFSSALLLNTHNRSNRALREKLGALYYELLHQRRIIREKYVLTHMMRRLRVGFVSRYLYEPTIGLYMDDLIPQLSQLKYETFAFVLGLSSSMKTQTKVPQIADQVRYRTSPVPPLRCWGSTDTLARVLCISARCRQVCALPDDLVTARNEISAAKIDVLIYPEIGRDRLAYFLSLSRLAPVQAAWWGNPDTSGVQNIDYRLVSEYEHENFREHYSEKKIFQFKYVLENESELAASSNELWKGARAEMNGLMCRCLSQGRGSVLQLPGTARLHRKPRQRARRHSQPLRAAARLSHVPDDRCECV